MARRISSDGDLIFDVEPGDESTQAFRSLRFGDAYLGTDTGDIVFRAGRAERARIKADGTGSGFGALLGGSIAYLGTPTGVDDTATITAAVADLSADGGGVIRADHADTYLYSQIVLPANVKIEGALRGGTVLKALPNTTAGFAPITTTGGSRGATFNLAADVAEGVRSFALATGAGANFAVGDSILIFDSAGGAQVSKIAALSGDTVTLRENTFNAYPAATTTFRKVVTVSGIEFADLTLDLGDVTGTDTSGLQLQWTDGAVIRNVEFLNAGVHSITGSGGHVGGGGLVQNWTYNTQLSNARFVACGQGGVAACHSFQSTGMQLDNVFWTLGGFGFYGQNVCGSTFNGIKMANPGGTWPGRGFKLISYSSYNSGAGFDIVNAGDNCMAFASVSHHNTFAGAVLIGGQAQENLWFDGTGNHHNVVTGVVAKYGNTRDITFGASDHDNYVEGDFDPAKVGGPGLSSNRAVSIGSVSALPSIVAAATLTLPSGRAGHDNPVIVTGNTGVTSITATVPGDKVTLQFTGTPTVTKGSNLKLNSNFVASGGFAVLHMYCDGTNWVERGRSIN